MIVSLFHVQVPTEMVARFEQSWRQRAGLVDKMAGFRGLEVLRDGAWHGVAPRAGALVVNIGDIVQVWFNDRYRAAVHRAVTHAARDRYSAPFFFNPSYDARYAPLPATVDAQRPARYRPIAWREFRALRAAGDYADLGEEVQIHHYRLPEP